MTSDVAAQEVLLEEPVRSTSGSSGEGGNGAGAMTVDEFLDAASGMEAQDLNKLKKGIEELLRDARCADVPAELAHLNIKLIMHTKRNGYDKTDEGNDRRPFWGTKLTCEVNGMKLEGSIEELTGWHYESGVHENRSQHIKLGPVWAGGNSCQPLKECNSIEGVYELYDQLGITGNELWCLLKWVIGAVTEKGCEPMLADKIDEVFQELLEHEQNEMDTENTDAYDDGDDYSDCNEEEGEGED